MKGRFIYGQHPVKEAIKSGRAQLLYLAPKHELERDAHAAKISVEIKTTQELSTITGGAVHQGAVAIVGEYRYVEIDEILAAAPALVLVLDSVQDPHNLGALIRSAHVMGASG